MKRRKLEKESGYDVIFMLTRRRYRRNHRQSYSDTALQPTTNRDNVRNFILLFLQRQESISPSLTAERDESVRLPYIFLVQLRSHH